MADTEAAPMQVDPAKSRRDKALEDYRKRLIDHKELDDKLKKSKSQDAEAEPVSHTKTGL